MTAWEVKDSLAELTVWEDNEDESILSLCKSSLKEIEAMLKADADRTDVRIASAAAALAYYKLSVKKSFSSDSEDVTSFKAGDVSITQSRADTSRMLDKAEVLYRNALEAIIPLCTDNGFAFENIVIKVKI